MTQTAFETASNLSYGLVLAGYLIFAFWVGLASRGRAGTRSRVLLLTLGVTAVWAAACVAVVAAPSPPTVLGFEIADALRYGAWFVFLWHLLAHSEDSSPKSASWSAFAAVGVVLVASVLFSQTLTFRAFVGPSGTRMGHLLHLGLAVFGLMLVEQIVHRVHAQMRWGIKPLAVALVGIFGFDLFLYADALLFGGIDADIWVARAPANLIVIPLIALATARSTGWTIPLHVSRRVVFHSSALLVSGIFLLAIAGAGYFVRYFGGDWGRALQIELLFAALVLVVLITSSGRFRSRLKVFVSKHFFSYRYDYREEWLHFTQTLSTVNESQTLPVRTIAALATLVESPGGLLFLRDESLGFAASARWNVPPCDAGEPVNGSLATFLQSAEWVIDVSEYRRDPSRYAGLTLPDWIESLAEPWVVVPLISGVDLLGFVVLMAPRTPVKIDWEVRDLLKTASRQAASYLGQVQAAEALLEARKFDAFNRMSAFVVHDLKNLVSQLALMHKNAERHRDNPDFQSDMLATIAHVVKRMNGLMLQLRTGTVPIESARHVDLDSVLRGVCAAKSDGPVPIDLRCSAGVTLLGHEDRLEHVIGHLVQNAIDATPPGQRVEVRASIASPYAIIEIIDRGNGMTPEFVRERLFKPFQTTKPTGLGIGVYESQQYLKGVGGEIRVDTAPGAGTRVEVRLRLTECADAAPAAQPEERVA